MSLAIERMQRSLEGLSVGDALGQCFFGPTARMAIERRLPAAPWYWTDDTQMALSIVDVLARFGTIDQDALAAGFVARFTPGRGYAGGAMQWCERVGNGLPWEVAARELFGGQGSFGNGGAMRAAPIGAYFAGDPARAATEGARSAEVTHAHPEGQAGAAAVAVAAALAATLRGRAMIEAVAGHTPAGAVRRGLEAAAALDPADPIAAARAVGTGRQVSAQDTVPWSIFCAAHGLADYEEALWITAAGLGDVDTTCAIVGGIVALVSPPPAEWLKRREALG